MQFLALKRIFKALHQSTVLTMTSDVPQEMMKACDQCNRKFMLYLSVAYSNDLLRGSDSFVSLSAVNASRKLFDANLNFKVAFSDSSFKHLILDISFSERTCFNKDCKFCLNYSQQWIFLESFSRSILKLTSTCLDSGCLLNRTQQDKLFPTLYEYWQTKLLVLIN